MIASQSNTIKNLTTENNFTNYNSENQVKTSNHQKKVIGLTDGK